MDKMTNNIAIPESYTIYQQDLSKDYLQLKLIGKVRNINEARTMCKVFSDCDSLTKSGLRTYIFVCENLKGENSNE